MSYVWIGLACFVAGIVVCWLFKAPAIAKLKDERDALKESATRAIGKL